MNIRNIISIYMVTVIITLDATAYQGTRGTTIFAISCMISNAYHIYYGYMGYMLRVPKVALVDAGI